MSNQLPKELKDRYKLKQLLRKAATVVHGNVKDNESESDDLEFSNDN
jgi:hypothetical protein